ncbi:hypothetical protein GCM10027443_25650 [Pontibacter brevis]
MKEYMCVLLLVFFQLAVQAQHSGAISGSVTAKDGSGIEGVSVVLKESSQSTITGSDGAFSIGGLGFGEYTVIAQGLGFGVVTRQVVLSAGAPNGVCSLYP